MQNEVAHKTISMMGMFQDSDLFMKLLMLALLFASVWCWAIIIDKVVMLRRTREKMKIFEEKFWHASSLAECYKDMPKKVKDPLSLLFVNAYQEWMHLQGQKTKNLSIKMEERLSKVMQITIDKQVEKLETKMVFLASTGSVAPLLGLFGTVWGIMNSFNAIGAMQSANIAAVAPGVAEALLTTAVGLIAAIPAVLGYNKISNDINRIAARAETFSDELVTVLATNQEGE